MMEYTKAIEFSRSQHSTRDFRAENFGISGEEDRWRSFSTDQLLRRIDAFAELPDDYDSYGACAPDVEVIRLAKSAVLGFKACNISIERVTPGPGGEIEFMFRGKSNSTVRVAIDEDEWQVAIATHSQPTRYEKLQPSEGRNAHLVLQLLKDI